ncbi:MAG: alpha/beta hydrolase [Sodalinema sp.]|uniref:alpha/beta hydrolase n=1 Tax=Sodalinema sp. TaxID=3080550 RepID=UPI00122871B1|nr:MAG: alpha/beta hydrolase [Phormidium sp. SL48-SHIP]
MDAIEIRPQTGIEPRGALILLHGWGANARDLASLLPILDLPDYLCFCLEAPLLHPLVPGGKMWYDLETPAYTGLEQSRAELAAWLDEFEGHSGIPLRQTILGGFSQGGAMTLDVGFHYPLAGLVAMSGYLHGEPQLQTPIPPVLVMHGRFDRVVPLTAAQRTRDTLTAAGATVEYHEFDMAHEICPQEVVRLRQFSLDVSLDVLEDSSENESQG